MTGVPICIAKRERKAALRRYSTHEGATTKEYSVNQNNPNQNQGDQQNQQGGQGGQQGGQQPNQKPGQQTQNPGQGGQQGGQQKPDQQK